MALLKGEVDDIIITIIFMVWPICSRLLLLPGEERAEKKPGCSRRRLLCNR